LESLNASQITDTSSGGSLQNLSAVRSDSGLLNNTDSVTALDVQSSLKQFKDKINQISRRLEEEKTQNHLLKQELRQANRALAQEIGEEMTVQKVCMIIYLLSCNGFA
jgi:predicted RNase H-like nuclease (RuvC/YqgF family)